MDADVTNGGGIAERPGNMADIFHTFFGIAGLSLLGYFDRAPGAVKYDFNPASYSLVDPTFALPVPVLASMRVTCEVRSDATSEQLRPKPSVSSDPDQLMALFAALDMGFVNK